MTYFWQTQKQQSNAKLKTAAIDAVLFVFPKGARLAKMVIVISMDTSIPDHQHMSMKTMTARDAKTHFGELLDTMRREPVIVTKNNRPVGIMISIEDAADTLIPEMFMEKEPGYEAWFQAKVGGALDTFKAGKTHTADHDDMMGRVWARLQARTKP